MQDQLEADVSEPPHWLMMGTPCNPFSPMRTKRYAPNSVQEHRLYKATFEDAYKLLKHYSPVTATMEQSSGFNAPFSTDDPVTPLDRPGALTVASSGTC